MARRARPEEEATLSMTPLLDVVLLLLIFYMVTTAFIDREIELQLPESDASAIPEEKKKFTIEIGREEHEVALNGELVTIGELEQRIALEAAADNIQCLSRLSSKPAPPHAQFRDVVSCLLEIHGRSSVEERPWAG